MDQSVFFQEEMCMSIPGNTCACTLQNYPIHKHTYERCHTEKLPTTEICAALVRPQDIKPEVYPWPAGVRDGFAFCCSLLCMPSCPSSLITLALQFWIRRKPRSVHVNSQPERHRSGRGFSAVGPGNWCVGPGPRVSDPTAEGYPCY